VHAGWLGPTNHKLILRSAFSPDAGLSPPHTQGMRFSLCTILAFVRGLVLLRSWFGSFRRRLLARMRGGHRSL
jgi:hypothetical protein